MIPAYLTTLCIGLTLLVLGDRTCSRRMSQMGFWITVATAPTLVLVAALKACGL